MDTSSSPPRIALVDDDADVRVAMHALLRSCGYHVSLYGGAQALLAAGLADIDCVVSDVQMPDMDGLTLLARLRAMPGAPPCILMTAFYDEHLRARALEGGAACFLAKPVDDEGLLACVRAACGAA